MIFGLKMQDKAAFQTWHIILAVSVRRLRHRVASLLTGWGGMYDGLA